MFQTLKQHIGILIILLIALFVRIPLISGSVWMDEAAQILESERPLNQQLEIVNDFQPPLLHLLLHFALYINDSVPWLRVVGALIPGLITIYATYRIGTLLKSKQVGLVASALIAVSSFHVFYSQELRQYSLPAMFAVLSWLEIIRVTCTDEKKRVVKPFIRFSIFTILGLYSSYLYPFLFFSQLVYLLFHSKRWLPYTTISTAISIVAFLPWIPMFLRQLTAGGLVRQSLPGWSEVVSVPQLKAIPLTILKFIYGVLNIEPSLFFAITIILIGLLIAMLLFINYRTSIKTFFTENKAVLIWFIVPLLTSWIVSFFIPVVQPKRVLFLLPAFALFLSTVLIKTWPVKKSGSLHTFRKTLVIIFAGLYLYISSFSLFSYWTDARLQRENWQALHTTITEQFPVSQTVLIFSFPAPFASWEYYDRNTYPTFSTGTLSIANAPNISDRLKTLDRYRYLLVFDYLRDLTDPEDRLITEIEAFGYTEAQVIDYPNIGFVRVFTKPESILSTTF